MKKKAPVLEITQLGHPVLRAKAPPIRQLRHPALAELLEAMLATVHHVNGVGIAAPQVGASCRAFWITPYPNKRYPKSPRMKPLAMINPVLLAHSKETVDDWEGCLSIPGLRGRVPRYRWVEVAYRDREGQRHQVRLKDFIARIFQHEFDHLNGKVYVDRVRDRRTFMTEAEYGRQKPYVRRR